MRWEIAGWCMVVLCCVACGESSGNKPNTAAAGASGGGSAGAGGSTNGQAGSAGSSAGGSSSGGTGASVGMCSGSTNQTSGGRIKARWWVTAEGDRAWDTWWDTQLNASCDFNPTSDGVRRCIPNNWDSSEEYFTDDQCTQAVYTRMSTAPCEPADYIMQFLTGTCDAPGGYTFNKPGAMATPSLVYQKFNDTCMAQPTPTEPLYAKGAEVPPSMFMEATPAEYGAGPRIKTQGYSTSDGTKQVSGWRDTQLDNVNCYFDEAEDGKLRCLPQRGGSIAGYADTSCSALLIDATPGCDKKVPDYAVNSAAYQCGYEGYEILKRGAAFAGDRYVGTPESCTVGMPIEGAMLYQSVPAPLDSFQEVMHTVDETDPGRLKPRYYDAGAGGCWFHNFWDSELKHACSFGTASDMKERCLPNTGIGVLRTFTDAACTVPAPLSEISECAPATLPEYSINEMPGECGRRKYEVWKAGEQVAGTALPPLWRDYGVNGGCIVFQPTAEKTYLKLTLADPTLFMAGEPMIQ